MQDKTNKFDAILREINFDDVITTVHANGHKVSEESIRNVYKDILAQNLADAEFVLTTKMNFILETLKK